MHEFLNQPFHIGSFRCRNRLIQGPLAGYSCAPFRTQFYHYTPPAYCVTEMISAHDVLYKHTNHSRYLYRAPEEQSLCYQLSGHDGDTLAKAALCLAQHGADLIDLNCGCPKTKIRKKGAGSALLDDPSQLATLVATIRQAIQIPFTVKIRIVGDDRDIHIAKTIEAAGADALIVHGRGWQDDYDVACNIHQIAAIKRALTIPVIANGDVACRDSLERIITTTGCDGVMIARASTGNPWLFQHLLAKPGEERIINHKERVNCFMKHLHDLAKLESEYQAVMQSKSLGRYYFKQLLSDTELQIFYTLNTLTAIQAFLTRL